MSKANDHQVGGEHYQAEYQHWDLIVDHRIGYLEGVGSKYPTRWRKKDGAKDAEKTVHYIDKLIEKAEDGLTATGYASDSALARFFLANDITDRDEMMIIQLLCQWKGLPDLYTAKAHAERLLVKARTYEENQQL